MRGKCTTTSPARGSLRAMASSSGPTWTRRPRSARRRCRRPRPRPCRCGNPVLDAFQHEREERVGRRPTQKIQTDDQDATLSLRGHGSQVHTELLGRIRLRSVQAIARRERDRHVREREDVPRIEQPQRTRLRRECPRLDDACPDLAAVAPCVGDDRGLEAARRSGQQVVEDGVGARKQEQTELGIPVQIEQHELTAICRQMSVQRGDERRGADREIDHGLKREDGRQAGQPVVLRVPRNLLLQRARQERGLSRSVDGEGVVLERVELGQHTEPGRLGKRGKHGRQPEPPREPCERGDPDHR